MAPKAGRGSDQFVVRLPDGLRERIKEAAEHSGRSMNAEVVQAITDALDRADRDRKIVEFYAKNPERSEKLEASEARRKEFEDRNFDNLRIRSLSDIDQLASRVAHTIRLKLVEDIVALSRARKIQFGEDDE